MERSVDGEDERTALELTSPPGLLVRRLADEHGEAPFRAASSSTCEITFAASPPPQSSSLLVTLVVSVAAAISGVIAGVAVERGSWLVAVIAFAVFVPLSSLMSAVPGFRPQTAQPATLAIDPDHVRLPGGDRVALADVRRIEVVRIGGAHAVQVGIPDGDVTVAATAVASHARYIADEIRYAYRAYLRRRR